MEKENEREKEGGEEDEKEGEKEGGEVREEEEGELLLWCISS